MRKLFIILIIAGVFSLIVGCVQKNDIVESQNNNTLEYSIKADLVNYNAIENEEEINNEEQFEVQLREFYDFTQVFFPIWNNHIEETIEIFEKFNNKNTSQDDKIICSLILVEKYKKFRDELMRITPPSEASKAYDFSLNAISKRILFFEEFEKGTSMQTLIEIENEVYFYETLFWEEIDKIYDHYLGKIDKKNNIQA